MGNHSDHGSPKKVVFGAPLIMGLSFWLFAFFFLSFCDGHKGHGEQAENDHKNAETEQTSRHGEKEEGHGKIEAVVAMDTTAVAADRLKAVESHDAEPAEHH